MELDALRLSIGPWNGRYSSVWRIWVNQSTGDVYMGVSALLNYLKISLHDSGKFRAAFVSSYNQLLVEEGKDAETDRAFLKWEKISVLDGTIMQALDIHFPLSALSLGHKPKTKKGKKLILIQPDEESLGENDTVTMKLLFHKSHPESIVFTRSLDKRNIIPVFNTELHNKDYLTIAFLYSKQLPIVISKREQKGYVAMMHDLFKKSEKRVGDKIGGLTIQTFQMGRPPSILNIGGVSVCWDAEKNFSINIGN